MARTYIDVSLEKFGDTVTLAHLAETAFAGLRSETITIGCCRDILSEDWPWEIADLSSEWGCGVSAMFTDGSILEIDAWGDI